MKSPTQFNLNKKPKRRCWDSFGDGRAWASAVTTLYCLDISFKTCCSTTTTATRQRLHTSRMRSFSFQLGLCDVLCKFQHHLASARHTDTDDTLIPPLEYLVIYFFFKHLLNMATKKKEREFMTTCLAFLLHFPPPSFSFHALLPKIHIEIDRECLIFRPQPPTSEGYSIESNCLTKKKKKPIITIQL